MGEVCVAGVITALLLPKAETGKLETKLGFVKNVGDSVVESAVEKSVGEELSLNNRVLMLLSNFAPSALGTGRCSLGSFAAMMSMGPGVVLFGMGPPNARRWHGESASRGSGTASRGGGVIGI